MLVHTSASTIAMATKENSFYAALGQRIAARRKARGMTQVELAGALGIAQQTMAHYEGGVSRIPVETLTQVAAVLDASTEDLIGDASLQRGRSKRGPVPKVQQQLEQVSRLPRARQRMVSEVLDSLLAQAR